MRKVVLAAVLVLMASGAQAVTLDVVGGQLLGASDVLVDGSLYDVEFLDGTCIERYNGCDDVSDFTFQTQASAVLASQALLDQVFLDGPLGSFDTDPGLTSGISVTVSPRAETPFSFFEDCCIVLYVAVASAVNTASLTDYVYRFDDPLYTPATSSAAPWHGGTVWAVWASQPIPEPSTALLVGLGLVGMAARRRV